MALSLVRQKQADEWPRERRRQNQRAIVPAPTLGYGFVLMNKCGATAATHYITQRHGGSALNIASFREQYPRHELATMWRSPFERTESIYRWARRSGPSESEFFPDWKLCWHDWVLELCSRPVDSWYDLHVASQTWLSGIDGKLPSLIMAWNWKQFAGVFSIPGPIVAMNQSDHSIPCMWSLELTRAVAHHYAEDLRTWERVNGT